MISIYEQIEGARHADQECAPDEFYEPCLENVGELPPVNLSADDVPYLSSQVLVVDWHTGNVIFEGRYIDYLRYKEGDDNGLQ